MLVPASIGTSNDLHTRLESLVYAGNVMRIQLTATRPHVWGTALAMEDVNRERRDKEGAIFGHHGEECSFDAIVKKYNVKDDAIGRLALIVRGADTPRRDLTPESRGLEAIAEGFKRLAAAQGYDDHETLRRERHLYDALYLYCGGDPKKLRRD